MTPEIKLALYWVAIVAAWGLLLIAGCWIDEQIQKRRRK